MAYFPLCKINKINLYKQSVDLGFLFIEQFNFLSLLHLQSKIYHTLNSLEVLVGQLPNKAFWVLMINNYQHKVSLYVNTKQYFMKHVGKNK